jgi:hypothetical protein
MTIQALPARSNLVGLSFVQGHWRSERGTILAQVAPEHYLVRSSNPEDKSIRVVDVRDMKSWKFFSAEAELKQWIDKHSEEQNFSEINDSDGFGDF